MSGPGTFFGIEIARRGLSAHQKSLEVTGHNIANANNPDYTRQEAVHTTGFPYPPPASNSGTIPGQMGSGVDIEEVRRIRNEYLDAQVRTSTSAKSFWDAKLEIFEQIESVFPEPDGRGIQEVMLNFFSDWHDLNNAPQDPGIMAAVVESGKELSRLFRDTYIQLQNVNRSIMNTTSGVITEGRLFDQAKGIKELSNQIANLNDSITRVTREGRNPNDLLDKRDALLDELAGFGSVKVEPQGDFGAVKVTMFPSAATSLTLVETGKEMTDIEVSIAGSQITMATTLEDQAGVSTTDSVILTDLSDTRNGSLLGTISAWRQNDTFISDLNQLSRSLGNVVNQVYNPGSGPADFWQFKDSAGNPISVLVGNAGQMFVNDTLVEDPSQLDGAEALDVGRLRNETFTSLWTTESTGTELTGTDDTVYASVLGANISTYFDSLSFPATVTFDQNGKSFDITLNAGDTYDNLISKINTGAANAEADLRAGLKQDTGGNWEFFVSSTKPGDDYEVDITGLSGGNPFSSGNAFDIGDGNTFESYYQGYIAILGSRTKSATDMAENQQAILDQIQDLQDSTSGVSLDEELSRMMEFQYGYQASARLLSTLDTMLDTLINRTAV